MRELGALWLVLFICLPLEGVLGQGDAGTQVATGGQGHNCLSESLVQELCSLKARLEKLENERKATPKIAFSAALRESGSGNTGPFGTDTPLQYAKVFANVGSCYNPSTGVFTAMVKGVYYFRFTAFNNIGGTPNTNVVLMKNSERTVSMWDKTGQDMNDSASSGVVLELEVGDNVFIQLLSGTHVYDDQGYYNSFSGFLLFPL